jgi:hypothetical protein
MAINLTQCDQACTGCVKKYKKKFRDTPSFDVSCKGIPIEYVPGKVLALLPESEAKSAISMLDPVSWAAQILDWHCVDPDGSIWKRKSEANSLPQGVPNYFDNIAASNARIAEGKSPFHRPYQAEMLRCSAKRKIFRIGRQAGKTETLVVAMLHALFTNRNFKILLLTPFSAQIEMIFGRVEQFLNDNPLLYNSKKRMVKAPNYTLELHNGSYVRGFTAGTQSKGEAAQVRGQSANMLVFDEADYLSRADLDAALAVTINFPEATVWMSSTPSGRREKFYENCKSKIYKEFHFPSQVNPNWTAELDRDFRDGLTDIGYKHEVLAEFGELQEGVFKSGQIEAAMSHNFNYGDMKREAGWHYCIGVDWNDVKIGTTISVVGYHPGGKFYVVERKVVQKENWTQHAACLEIVMMNRKWIPDFIYIDRGYGSTQDEILRKIGYDSIAANGAQFMDSRLARIVKAYDFGSHIEIRDLFTKQPIKKHAKPFLVENTVRRFESHQILFPPSDKQLEAELRGYIIDRVTQTGVPVYKQGNEKVGDHNLDALMLALVAFEMEMTAFGKPQFDAHIAFSGKIGEVINPMTSPGEIVIQNNFKRAELASKAAENARPELKRTDNFTSSGIDSLSGQGANNLPAANTANGNKGPKLWSWPGFNRDAPPPSRSGFMRQLRKSMAPPKRKKF